MSDLLNSSLKENVLKLAFKISRLDASCARDLKAEFTEIWKDGIQSVEIDFSKVEFIDSSGIGALLSVHKKLDPNQGGVLLLNVQSQVQAVIELLRLHRIFEIRN
ncbi:MAG: STAS domain-containing protein [Verrucomicrobiota bacterium]